MKYRVTLNGKIYEVEVADGEAVLLDTYEANLPAAPAPAVQPAAPAEQVPAGQNLAAGEVVKAPMPGNILQIKVQKGQKVQAGQVLLTLEAMKMEIPVVAPQDGTVASIDVAVGAAVENGDVLATMN